MNTRVTCQDVLDALYELIDCEECDRRSGLIDAGSVPGPDARARALMIQHVATCEHCSDALDAERHVRALMRGCYESEQASDALRARRRLYCERVRQLALNLARGLLPAWSRRRRPFACQLAPRANSRIDKAW